MMQPLPNQLTTYKVLVTAELVASTQTSVAPSASISTEVLEFGTEDEAEYAIFTLNQVTGNGRGDTRMANANTRSCVKAIRTYKQTKKQPWQP